MRLVSHRLDCDGCAGVCCQRPLEWFRARAGSHPAGAQHLEHQVLVVLVNQRLMEGKQSGADQRLILGSASGTVNSMSDTPNSTVTHARRLIVVSLLLAAIAFG